MHISWVLGLVNLGVVVVSWVLSLYLVLRLAEDNLYRKPFFITYLNTGLFVLYLVPFAWRRQARVWLRRGSYQPVDDESDGASLTPEVLAGLHECGANSPLHVRESSPVLPPISLRETVMLSSQFSILWFLANLVTNASLSYTTVGSQTILSSTSLFCTLGVGYLAGVETFTSRKVLGICLLFIGVVIVTTFDRVEQQVAYSALSVFFGNTLALAGAVLYGVYTILLKKRVKDELRMDMRVFFGFVGVFTLVCLWPSLILLHATGLETFELPPSAFVWQLLAINGAITFVSDFCWARAMLLTSPLTVTVGLSTTIPLAMVLDWVIKGVTTSAVYLLGAVLICFSFSLVGVPEDEPQHSD